MCVYIYIHIHIYMYICVCVMHAIKSFYVITCTKRLPYPTYYIHVYIYTAQQACSSTLICYPKTNHCAKALRIRMDITSTFFHMGVRGR